MQDCCPQWNFFAFFKLPASDPLFLYIVGSGVLDRKAALVCDTPSASTNCSRSSVLVRFLAAGGKHFIPINILYSFCLFHFSETTHEKNTGRIYAFEGNSLML